MTKDKSRIQSCIDHINTAIDVDPWAKELVAEMGKEILKAQLSKEDTTSDCISRRGAIDICNNVIDLWQGQLGEGALVAIKNAINNLPSVQPERLSDDDFETIRIHLSAIKERLGNQHRWKEAEDYQRLIDRFMSFAERPEIMADGTLHITVNADVANIDRILLSQAGTHTGDLYYKDDEKPEPQWIPCRETVDIPDHEILACDKYGEEMFGYLSYEDDQWLCESDGYMMYDPIAWREKPEPYREGE